MKARRILSLLMAIVTVFSAFGLTAFATTAEAEPLFSETFDTGTYTVSTEAEITAGTATKYTMNDSGFCYVRNMGGEHKNAAWLPGAYHNNFDRSPALSYTESTGNITASADYYIDHPKDATGKYIDEAFHFAIRTTNGASSAAGSGNPAFATIRRYQGDDNYYLFLDTSKSSQWASYNGSITYVNAEGFVKIQPNTWFTIVIDFNLKTGFYTLTYRDADRDVVLGSAKVGLSASTFTGMENITLPANTLAMGYVVSSNGASNPTDHISLYMDNVQIGYTEPKTADASIDVTNDFEDYSDQKSLTTSNFNYAFSAVAPYYKVLSETVAESSNQFLRVPFLYGGDSYNSGTTNYDKPFTIKHNGFDKTNGRYMIYEADFRYDQSETKANVQLQVSSFTFEDENGTQYNGRYLALLDINLQTGVIGGNGTITKTGAEGLAANEWTHVKLVIDFEEGAYRIYVNGVMYGYNNSMNGMYDGGSAWVTVQGIKNIEVPANNLIVAKIFSSYTAAESYAKADAADGTYSNVNHMDIDNIHLTTTNTMPPIVLPPVTAENDFEGYSDKQTLTTSNGFQAVTPYNKVLSETVSGADNKFLRVPFLYGGDTLSSGTTNYDIPFTIKHDGFDKTNGRYMIYEADFRYDQSETKANVQLQLNNFDFEDASGNTYNGRYLALFDINLQTGVISGNSAGITRTGAKDLVANEWTRVKLVIDLENGSYRIYVNGVMYGYYDSMNGMYDGGGWKTVSNIKNIEVPADNLIVAKIYNSYTAAESWSHVNDADGTYSNVNHMDIDNIYLETTNTMPPIVLPPIDALEDFENGTVGSALSSSNSSTTTAYNKVLSETVEGNANQFLRVPLLYDGTGDNTISTDRYTNYDKTVTMKHSTISTETGKYAVFTVDYRPHAEANASTGTIEIQIHNYKFDALVENGSQKSVEARGSTYAKLTEDEKGLTGIYLKLFDINLETGELTGNGAGSLKKTGADGLNPDVWNTVQFVMNLEDSSSCLYVNGSLYGVSEKMQVTSSAWYYYTNPSNIVFTDNCLFAAKVNKKDEAFNKLEEADEAYSNVNYIDIDNVSIASATEKDITVLDPVNEDGDALMYVEIKGQKVANEYLYLTGDIEYEVSYFDPDEFAYDGIISTVQKSSIRLKAQAGLRFATEIVDMEAFDALFALEGEDFKDVAFGTLITPEVYVSDIDFTVEALKTVGRQYLEVEANYGYYYAFDDSDTTTHFVGSIVNLRSGNVNRPFSAIGYIKITLWGGQEFYFYSDVSHTANVKEIANLALNDKNMTWSAFEKSILEAYAEGDNLDATIAEDMKGLNVLAFGDSLFGGTIGYDQATQWVNKLGVDNEWNLTNLGIGSMTVSLTERNNVSEYGNKNSMYDWMFNEKNDFRWGSTSTHTSPNPFFKTGDISGDPEDVELIILEGGCNDYGTAISAPLGTVDSKDPGTFLGAWNCITEELLEQYPNATIVFLTTWRLNPQPRTDDTLTSIEFSESVITLYNEKYASNDRIALIDAGDPAVSGVDMLDAEWRTEYSTDSYHLKDTGMAVMADHMLPLLWEIVMKAR